jgi:peptidoglycan/LPS O-acetylase OafA/YrhL
MRLQLISKYRTELMGIAILWIVFYHLQIDLGESLYLAPLHIIQTLGYGGVDLFFFLSGFGVTAGWLSKNYNIAEFYKKRLIRIIPTYWLWMLLYGFLQLALFQNFKIRGFIADFLGIGFLSGKSYNSWFIPAIVVCYLIFPLTIRFLMRSDKRREQVPENIFSMLFRATWLPLLLSLVIIAIGKSKLLLLTVRLPNFVLGALVSLAHFKDGAQNLEDLRTNRVSLIVLNLLGIVLLYFSMTLSTDMNWKYGFWWYPFIILAFPLCLLLANGIAWSYQHFSENTVVSVVSSLLRFCGKYSLEIYLMHSLIFAEFRTFLDNFFNSSNVLTSINRGNIFEGLLLIAVSLIAAYLLNQITQCVLSLLKDLPFYLRNRT